MDYEDARDSEQRAYAAAVVLEREQAEHRKTRLELVGARRELVALRRLVLAYDAVLPEADRARVGRLAVAVDQVFDQTIPDEAA